MHNNSTQFTLIAPGCFTAIAHNDQLEALREPVESTPELNNASVFKSATRSYEQALAEALHQPVPELSAIPAAQYRFLSDTDKKAPPHCVCAELIHFQADKDNARLIPMQALEVTEDESNRLIVAFNDLVCHDGLEVLRTQPGHYYLTGMPAGELDTWPAHAVANGKIADYLPRKSAAGDWRRLMTEVQMLFHDHPVNVARAEARQLPINGMWFWGGTHVSTDSFVDNIDLYAADAYTAGLATAMNIEHKPLDHFDWSDLAGDIIVVELGVYAAWLRADYAGMQSAKQALQEQWIIPAQQAVANGLCGEFKLDGCEGQAIVEKPKPISEPQFWKRFSIGNWFKRANKSDTSP